MIEWGWVTNHLGAVASRTGQHLELAGIAVIAGFVISFGLAVISVKRRATYPPINAISGILYTIPSLALFATLVPITGITLVTVEIPLILYTFVIFVRNIVAGFDSVPLEVLEAADGMGYRRLERFLRVELPLAIPLIVAGLRVASVSTIGLVTISATMGDNYGGLGFFILEGYHRGFPTEVFVGAIPSIALAILVDLTLVRLERWITPWTRARVAAGSAP